MEPGADWRQHLYHQTRLREKNGRIRLLTIQPRQYAASRPEAPPNTIHCFLRLAELQERPGFIVISHRWQVTDAADETKSVLVNGAAVPVSTGLFDVLHHVQRETEPTAIWIDALCTNQADEKETEKSVQVSQLAQIYGTADRKLIWLGPSADRSDEAMKVLRRLTDEQLTLSAYIANWTPQLAHQLAQKVFPSRFANSNVQSPPHGSNESLELQKELESLRAPLKALMEREYWINLWSLIELCLSDKGVIACGNHNLGLDQFYSAARALDHIINHFTYSKWLATATSPTSSGAQTAVLSGDEISNLSQSSALRTLGRRDDYRRDVGSWLRSPDNPLFTLLSRFYAVPPEKQLPLQINDVRDRVYALACLATDTTELGITIDYSKDIDQIYAETSVALLQKYPRVLQLAQGTAVADSKLPSWAINWENVRLPPSDLGSSERPFNACGPADIRFYRVDTSTAGQVSLKAAVVDRIEVIGAQYQPDEPGETDRQRSYFSEIKQFWEDSTASISSPYFAEQAAVALAKISVGDIEVSLASNTLTRASSDTVQGYKKTVDALFAPEQSADEHEISSNGPTEQEEGQQPTESKLSGSGVSIPYVTAMTRMAGRRPFRSQNGYIGLGPTDLATGDVIAIPYGSPVPLTFRRNGKGEDATCRLVGEVYVFGIMDGEFMKVHRQETMLHIV
ncbi:hypothetical protein F5Y19DRAFT_403927 [Xylariaceae sp. FL1651]|nr:hypothetical protein F5Y19DRAFT_403927 [Xylariaceae sp. FL1651]